eukprot:5412189-Pyramimonas_sp.AAC.1
MAELAESTLSTSRPPRPARVQWPRRRSRPWTDSSPRCGAHASARSKRRRRLPVIEAQRHSQSTLHREQVNPPPCICNNLQIMPAMVPSDKGPHKFNGLR